MSTTKKMCDGTYRARATSAIQRWVRYIDDPVTVAAELRRLAQELSPCNVCAVVAALDDGDTPDSGCYEQARRGDPPPPRCPDHAYPGDVAPRHDKTPRLHRLDPYETVVVDRLAEGKK